MGEQIYNEIQEYFGFPDKEEFLTIWNDFNCDAELGYAETLTDLTEYCKADDVILGLWQNIFRNIGEPDIEIIDWDTDYKTVEIKVRILEAIKTAIEYIESHGWEISNKAELLLEDMKINNSQYLEYLLELGSKYTLFELENIVKNGRRTV